MPRGCRLVKRQFAADQGRDGPVRGGTVAKVASKSDTPAAARYGIADTAPLEAALMSEPSCLVPLLSPSIQ